MQSPKACGAAHAAVGPDPQFLGNDTFGGWVTMTNHEIDIEIPANCAGTANVCNNSVPGIEGAKACIGDYSTANLNNYLFTQNSGTGPAYSNMCVKAAGSDGAPMQLLGDDKYVYVEWRGGEGGRKRGRERLEIETGTETDI
jgi:hypothetical protein